MTGFIVCGDFWKDKKVFVTGHTGFKGTWIGVWLNQMGARVCGYSLAPLTTPDLFSSSGLADKIEHHIGDIRNQDSLKITLERFQPDIVFHMAAQPLVKESYANPSETFDINVTGTAKVLEALKDLESSPAVVVVTTDKVYKNREWQWGYRESDALGGHDPYSASKACAELVVDSFRSSFFNHPNRHGQRIFAASVRAGNVIGGGDWSADRLIPDIVRAVEHKTTLSIRYPESVRPWQHVLEPLSVYLKIGQGLFEKNQALADNFNVGPTDCDCISVKAILDIAKLRYGRHLSIKMGTKNNPHEAGLLKLDCSKIKNAIGWQPLLPLPDALDMTFDWYQRHSRGEPAWKLMTEQIATFSKKMGLHI